MSDKDDHHPDDVPLTETEKKIQRESEFNKQWIEELSKKNSEDERASRPPLNKNNAVGRIFGNKKKHGPDENE